MTKRKKYDGRLKDITLAKLAGMIGERVELPYINNMIDMIKESETTKEYTILLIPPKGEL